MTVPAAKRPIPLTRLVWIYGWLRKMPQRERLACARRLLDDADGLAAAVAGSVAQFRGYDNVGEAFCGPHPPLPAPKTIANGRSLAAALAQRPQRVEGRDAFGFTLVDYEVRPARTTIDARLMLNAFEGGAPSTRALSADFLLRRDDGTAIVGEGKVVKSSGYDTDAFLALVQALAAATQLATPNQLNRLCRWYPGSFADVGQVDVLVVTYCPPEPPRAAHQAALAAVAHELAKRIVRSAAFPPELRNVDFVTASGDPRALRLVRA